VATDSEVVNQVHLSDIEKYLGRVITADEYIAALKAGEL